MPAFARKRRRRMTARAFARRQIQKLGPWPSLIVMLLPIVLVEPLKIAALWVAGEGHWLTGTGIMIAAYAASLLVVDRLFKVVKPKLMTLSWFARLWTGFTVLRDMTWSWLRNRLPPGRSRRQEQRQQVVPIRVEGRMYPFLHG